MTPDVVTVHPQATLQQCLAELLQRGFHAFPLVGDDRRLAGLVTSTDLFAALRRDVDLQQPLQSIATAEVQCLDRSQPVELAVEIMRRRNVKHVVIVDGDRHVVGIVSIKDVLRQIVVPAAATVPASG
jgi:CBS domain-containing protein